MARFSAVYRLTNSQAELDFVDIDLARDTPLFLDPYGIEIRDDEWSAACGDHLRSFFQEILTALREDRGARAAHLLGNLHEPNETCLGVSKGRPSGRAIGPGKAHDFATAIKDSRAFETGLLSDIAEGSFLYTESGRTQFPI